LLAREAVRAAVEEAERRQGSLDVWLSKVMNANQIAFLHKEIARIREDLNNKLEVVYASLLEASARVEKVKAAQGRAAALTEVNKKLDESLEALHRLRLIAESVTAAVTASMEATALHAERNTAPRYQAYAKEVAPEVSTVNKVNEVAPEVSTVNEVNLNEDNEVNEDNEENEVNLNEVNEDNEVNVNEVNEESTMNEASCMVCDIKEVVPEVSYLMNYEAELRVAHNEIKEEMSKGKPEVKRKGSFAAKSGVRTSWEPGESSVTKLEEMEFDVNTEAMEVSGVKDVMKSDGLTMMKVTEQSCCANWDPGEVVNAKDQMEMLNVEEVANLMNNDEVARSGGVKAMMFFYALFNLMLYTSDALVALCMARFVNEFRRECPIELSDYG